MSSRHCSLALLLNISLGMFGCSWFRPHGVKLTIENQSGERIRNLEVDFPGGSFGINSLPPQGTAERWFNPTAITNVKVIFNDSSGAHQAMLQSISPGQSGWMTIEFLPNSKVRGDLKPLPNR